MDYLQEVARAIADEDDQVLKIADRNLGRIEAEVAALRSEADLIRRLTDHVITVGINGKIPSFRGVNVPPAGQREAGDKMPLGLTDAEKDAINKIIDTSIGHAPDITAEALVAVIEGNGIPISARVTSPASVVGSMLYHARRRANNRDSHGFTTLDDLAAQSMLEGPE